MDADNNKNDKLDKIENTDETGKPDEAGSDVNADEADSDINSDEAGSDIKADGSADENVKTDRSDNGGEKRSRGSRAAQKRGIIIAFAVMVGIVLIWYAGIPAIEMLIEKSKKDENKVTSDYMDRIVSYVFYPEKYGEDVFADEEYMKKERHITYKNGPDTYLIADENYAQYGAPIVFFSEYFDAVIKGEYEDFNKFFTAHYLEEPTHRAKFTPQKIYDITIELDTYKPFEGGATYTFIVGFKILKNNGTFRNDIDSDMSRPIIYELIEEDGKVLINYIGATRPVEEEDKGSGCGASVGTEAVAVLLVCAAFPAVRRKRKED